ncbi:MAG: exonuclease SbcCD subunit D [Theionarchaea archaeon]|nr:exonuclease SbcCD subunit D [Theionarchaea archaeon]MBU7037013.1 exonuclease SbcCD subunit D [Theionarchaea archaeon]
MIVHAADAHLGVTRYQRIDTETGLNVRMMDFCSAFEQVVTHVLEIRPDAFVFSGDLFDRVNPTNFIRKFAQDQLKRLSAHTITTFLIPGNHETPRSKGVRNPLSLYLDIPFIHIRLEPFQKDVGPYTIAGVPFTRDPVQYIPPPREGRINVLMLHAVVEGAVWGSERFMEYVDDTVKAGLVPPYAYCALGHVHRHQALSNMVYSGSLERYDFNEKDEKKGFVVYDDDYDFVAIPSRDMIDFEYTCTGKTGFEITEESQSLLTNIQDKIVRLILKGELDPVTRKDTNFTLIREKAQDALHFSLKDSTLAEEVEEIKDEDVMYTPQEELKRYLEAAQKEEALSEGLTIIKEILG